ncbi:hypothetical protein ACTXT7_012329 [Hymenolepis weldensis]
MEYAVLCRLVPTCLILSVSHSLTGNPYVLTPDLHTTVIGNCGSSPATKTGIASKHEIDGNLRSL